MLAEQRSDMSGPAREGEALLQGLVRCGQCGRAMYVSYGGHRSERAHRTMQYRCSQSRNQIGGTDCQTIGGKRVDQTVVRVFLEVVAPAGLEALRRIEEQWQADNHALEHSWQLQLEKTEYEAKRAERQFQSVEPENRMVARELERRWNDKLNELERVRQQAQSARVKTAPLSEEEMTRARQLAQDLEQVWHSPTTTNRDRKRMLRCLIDEVQLTTEEKRYRVRVVWKGGAVTEREVERLAPGAATPKTPQDIVELVRQLSQEFDDAQIARILNRQGRRTARGNPFTQANVLSLRGHHQIPKCSIQQARDPKEGPFTADEAAAELGVTMTTIHRWLREGILVGTQMTPGAPWKIVLTDEVRRKLSGGDAPEHWVSVSEAARRLGVSKSYVVYLIQTGRLEAMQVSIRKQRCWRINLDSAASGQQTEMFSKNTNGVED
jgi:excisionase family DNA binding protein